MNYKIAMKGGVCQLWTGDEKKFKIKKTQDKVLLWFDEDEQTFYAQILNPSDHTKYLFDIGMLGIDLCKLNTGASQRKHMGPKKDDPDSYSYVKRHIHPRWSRIYGDGTNDEQGVHVQDLEGTTPLRVSDMGVRRYAPNQKHTLPESGQSGWYTAVKAILVNMSGRRSYKTCSNRIKVQYSSATEELSIRQPGQGSAKEPKMTVTIDHPAGLAANQRRVTLSNLNAKAQALFDAGKLYIATRYIDVRTRNTGGNTQRAHWGRNDEHSSSRRWAPMFDRKLKYSGPADSYFTMIDDLTTIYTIDTTEPRGIHHLLQLVGNSHEHGNRDPMTIERDAYIAVGYLAKGWEGSRTSGVPCALYQENSGYTVSWYSGDY